MAASFGLFFMLGKTERRASRKPFTTSVPSAKSIALSAASAQCGFRHRSIRSRNKLAPRLDRRQIEVQHRHDGVRKLVPSVDHQRDAEHADDDLENRAAAQIENLHGNPLFQGLGMIPIGYLLTFPIIHPTPHPCQGVKGRRQNTLTYQPIIGFFKGLI